MPTDEARAVGFIALILGNLSLAYAESVEIGTAIFDPRHLIFWAVAGVATGLLAVILAVPTLAAIFAIALPEPRLVGLAVAVAVAAGGWFAIARLLARWIGNGRLTSAAP